jgi:regulator of nucleoside diphosphate kinase
MTKTNEQNQVIITEEDYNMIRPYIGGQQGKPNEMSLAHELSRATIVKRALLPAYTVKLNSKVSILDIETQKVKEFIIVMPELADMQQNKISVLTPMGTALIGFKKGEEVVWQVPAGLKRFRILDVSYLK